MIATEVVASLGVIAAALATALGGYAAVLAKRNERRKDESVGRIDLLGASQASLKEALDRADAERQRADEENNRLRAEMLRMRNEHENDRIQWKAKFDAQDLELTSLRVQIRACQQSLDLLSHNSAPAKELPDE